MNSFELLSQTVKKVREADKEETIQMALKYIETENIMKAFAVEKLEREYNITIKDLIEMFPEYFL